MFFVLFRIISYSSARCSKKIAKTYVLSPVFVDKHYLHPIPWLHATCLDHSKVRRVRVQQWCQSMSISYRFVLFFVFLSVFSYLSISFRFFASHFVFYFVYVRTTDKNEQVTWTLFRILYFVWFFVSISYVFRIVSYVFRILSCQEPWWS